MMRKNLVVADIKYLLIFFTVIYFFTPTYASLACKEALANKPLGAKWMHSKEHIEDAEFYKSDYYSSKYLELTQALYAGEPEVVQSQKTIKLSNKLFAHFSAQGVSFTSGESDALNYYVRAEKNRQETYSEAFKLHELGQLEKHPEYRSRVIGSTVYQYLRGRTLEDKFFPFLQTAFNKSKSLPKGVMLYRGTVLSSSDTLPSVGKKMKLSKGLISTSIDQKIAKRFTEVDEYHRNYNENAVRAYYKITPDKSVKSIFIPLFAWKYNHNRLSRAETKGYIPPSLLTEEEVLLSHATSFTVTNIEKKKDRKGYYYEISVDAFESN